MPKGERMWLGAAYRIDGILYELNGYGSDGFEFKSLYEFKNHVLFLSDEDFVKRAELDEKESELLYNLGDE